MKKQFSEEELDSVLRHLVRNAGANDETARKIADSPVLWWGVQRQIASQKVRSPWPPSKVFRRWSMIAVPAAAGILMVAALSFLTPSEPTARVEVINPTDTNETTMAVPVIMDRGADAVTHPNDEPALAKAAGPRVHVGRRQRAKIMGVSLEPATRARSEFIALSYAGNPESGQMVRVKVPRSMMVSLGLVAAVEKPHSLVDADVIIGDDGMTHAIRFIH